MLLIIKVIILGLIQGFLEPLPISSSGHLIIFRKILNTNIFDNMDLLIILNFASLLAIAIIYYRDIKSLFSKQDKTNKQYILKLIISTIPALVGGLIIKLWLESYLSNMIVLAIAFLITCLFLLIISNKKGLKEEKDISYKDALVIGLFQMMALVPGISRSGLVLSGALLCNIKRNIAIKYTFMLYLPISIASFIVELFSLKISNHLLPYYSISFIICFITTYLAYQFLIKIVNQNKLYYFAIYCFLVFLFIIIYFH